MPERHNGALDDATARLPAVVVVEASTDHLVIGQPVELTAQVTLGGSARSEGTVTFADGTTHLGVAATRASSYVLSVASLGAGPHTIVAHWSGAAAPPSVSAPITVRVDPLWFPPPAPGTQGYRPATIPPFSGSGPSVALLGDSITSAIAGTFAGAANEAGYAVSITGLDGYALAATKTWVDLYAAQAPHVMIVNLGTNDVSARAGRADADFGFQHRLATVAAAFPRSCFVVTTITTHRPGAGWAEWNATAASFNAHLRASYPHVADWDAVVAAHPEYLPDGIHPVGSAAGVAALAATQVAAARACA